MSSALLVSCPFCPCCCPLHQCLSAWKNFGGCSLLAARAAWPHSPQPHTPLLTLRPHTPNLSPGLPATQALAAAALLCPCASLEAAAGGSRQRSLQYQPLPVATPQPIPLNGAPLALAVSTGVQYFSVQVPLPFTGLHVPMATAYGNCNLYASVQPPAAAWVQPTANASDYGSASLLASEVVDVYPTDAAVTRNCVLSYTGSSCTLVIAAACSVANSQIWLSAYTDGA